RLSSAEIYNPVTNTWSSAGSMAMERDGHTATLLSTGMVLVAGGLGAGGDALASAELYNPIHNTWSAAGSMNQARFDQTATLLNNGMVLIAGGEGSGGIGSLTGANSGILSSAELYDPTQNSWSVAGS